MHDDEDYSLPSECEPSEESSLNASVSSFSPQAE